MAILTEMQVAEIKSHMATSEDLLLKKFKTKNSKTENTTVPIAERGLMNLLVFLLSQF